MVEKFIFRTKAEKEYTVIRNSLIVEKKLSWEARGLIIYLLSKPETWIVMKKDLIEASPAAGKKISSILKELEIVGYIKRNKFRNVKGQWEWHTWVYDMPQPPPIPPKRGDGPTILPKTTHGEATPGNGANIVSTELKKKDIKNNEKEDIYLKDNIHQLYKNNIGELDKNTVTGIQKWKEKYSEKWIIDAIEKAIQYNKKTFGYINAILENRKKNSKNKDEDKDYMKDEFAEFIEN